MLQERVEETKRKALDQQEETDIPDDAMDEDVERLLEQTDDAKVNIAMKTN